jgi:hypothetical protein
MKKSSYPEQAASRRSFFQSKFAIHGINAIDAAIAVFGKENF